MSDFKGPWHPFDNEASERNQGYLVGTRIASLHAALDAVQAENATLRAQLAAVTRELDEAREASAKKTDEMRWWKGELLEREGDIERLNWLIAEGEKHFGTLWKDATFADIDAVRHAHSAGESRDG
jgi:chromosome segregation ATPase